MRNLNRVTLIFVLVLALMAAPVAAQPLTDDELTALDFINNAYRNTLAEDSFTLLVVNLVDQRAVARTSDTTPPEVLFDMELEQTTDMQVRRNAAGLYDSSMVLNQTATIEAPEMPPTTIITLLEFIAVDGGFFARLSDLSASPAPGSTTPDWFDLKDDPAWAQSLLGVTDIDAYTETIVQQWTYEFTPETVTSVVEQEPRTEDGRTLRVFSVTINPVALAESDELGDILALFEFMAADGMDTIIEQALAGLEMTMSIAIGADDNLLYDLLAETQMSVSLSGGMMPGLGLEPGQSVEFDQTMRTRAAYRHYGEPVEITAPEIARLSG